MSEFGHLDAILLGIVQGLTEFLPISSSGHLAIVQHWIGLDPHSPTMLLFDVLAHLGTLLAVLYVFYAPIRLFVLRLARECERGFSQRHLAFRVLGLAVVALVPTGVIGLTCQAFFEEKFADPRWIGGCLLFTGTILAALVVTPRGRRGWARFRWWQAGLVGLSQAAAILPGVSRSGATICTASYCGLRRRWAAEFSFLIAVPAIVAATILKTKDTLELPSGMLAAVPWGPVVLGSLGSLGVGIVALRILLGAVRRAKLHYFSVYCWVVGIGVLTGVLWP